MSRMGVALALSLISVFGFAATSCGGSDSSEADGSQQPAVSSGGETAGVSAEEDPDVAGAVPESVRQTGSLRVATDPTYPPLEFIGEDGETMIGLDIDLAEALGDVMGLEVEMQRATFDSILPGLTAGKFDLGIAGFTDTKEREEVVDFVTYFSGGLSFYTNAEGGAAVTTLDDLCGVTVAVQKGTTQADDAAAQDGKCQDAGQSAVEILTFPDQNGANLAVTSARAEVGIADSVVAAYIVERSSGQLELVGETYATAPAGVALAKDSPLTEAVKAGLEALIAGGQYEAIFDYWGVEDGAIDQPAINAAVN